MPLDVGKNEIFDTKK